MGLFHVSVGFVNVRTGLNATVEFAADKFDASLVIPSLNALDKTMKWSNTARVKPFEGQLDVNYWQYRTRLATINGTTYNAFLSWLAHAVQKFTRYDLFILESAGRQRGSPFMGFTCFDFAYKAIEHLTKLAGPCVFDRSLSGLLRNDVVLLAKEVESHAPSSRGAFSFYEAIERMPDLWSWNVSKTIDEISRLALEKWQGRAVYHESETGHYWSYKPARPFLTFRKRFAPLPGTCNPEKQILV